MPVTNEEAFWKSFSEIVGDHVREDEHIFLDFYQHEFQNVKHSCGFHKMARKVIDKIAGKGKRIILATNPLFPAIATESRIRWAGLVPEDFELYTTYENSRYCKPNPQYYTQILAEIGAEPEECLMVGNDVTEDMVAKTLGMNVFLLTDCIINKENKDISEYPNGDFEALLSYLEEVL